MDRRKFLLIIGIIITILLVMGVIIYFVWQGTKQTKGKSSVAIISDLVDKVYSPQYVQNQNEIAYYNQGLINKYSLSDKKITNLFPDKIAYIQKIKLSPNGNRGLVLVKERNDYFYKSIDFETREVTELSENIIDADWLNNDKIIYTYSDDLGSINNLNTANAKGVNIQKLTDLSFSNGIISLSPDKNKIIVYPEPEGYGENFLTIYDIATAKLEKFSQKGLVGAIWAPDNQNIITNIFTEDGFYTTTIFNITSQKTKNLDLNFELNKIVWLDNDNLVGALINKNGFDDFHLISAKNGKSKLINIPETEKSAINVGQIINYNSMSVLFTFNDFLYELDIKK